MKPKAEKELREAVIELLAICDRVTAAKPCRAYDSMRLKEAVDVVKALYAREDE